MVHSKGKILRLIVAVMDDRIEHAALESLFHLALAVREKAGGTRSRAW
jgi:hypothetical protein